MANTNDLKNIVEPAVLAAFWSSHGAQPIPDRTHLAAFVYGMELDGIGISRDAGRLYVCEVTASGYLGHRGKNFHVGAVRKFADAFARFSIVMHAQNREALLAAASRHHSAPLSDIECHLVVPKGSRFIQALGYRNRLLEIGVMHLTEVELQPEIEVVLCKVLGSASAEIA